MGQCFKYISSATQNGIVKLRALEKAWADDSAQFTVGTSGGQTSAAMANLSASLRSLDQDMAQLFAATIAYLGKIDAQFNNVDEDAASALYASAAATAKMNDQFNATAQAVAGSVGKEGGDQKGRLNLWKFLLGGFSINGAVGEASKLGEGSLFGFKTTGKLEGQVLSGSVETESGAEWDITNKEASIEASVEAKGSILSGTIGGTIGILGIEGKGSVGNVSATGSVNASLFKDGKLAPSIGAKAEAKATAIEGSVEAKAGDDVNNIHGKASGAAGVAHAEAGVQAGKIEITDEATGEKKMVYGAEAKAGAEAYVAEGKVSGGIKIAGVKIDLTLKGKLGGAGATASASAHTGGVSGEVGLGFLAGGGLAVDIDWSDCKLWPWNR